MLTRQQKSEQVKEVVDVAKKSGGLLFADFTKINVDNLNSLRRSLEKEGVKMMVIKKRLLKIALQQAGIDAESIKLGEQSGILFIPKEILSVAGMIYKFGQKMTAEKRSFKISGGYDGQEEKVVSAEEFAVLAKLPSREVLLSQLAIMLTMPIRQLAWALNARKEQLEQSSS